uniref:Spliceosome-associated protein CWC15 homolog n=1 Tax=Bos indicus x Bos taurus TaxID=30522 RepID=A0A4W2FSW4_BOBOX
MTTAARPTFEPARGGRGKDRPLGMPLKRFETVTSGESWRRERELLQEKKTRGQPTREHTTSSSVSKKPRLDQIPAANLDADDPLTDEEDEDEDFEEESDDDDTAALLAELEKIKTERAEEQARKEQEQKAKEERIRSS